MTEQNENKYPQKDSKVLTGLFFLIVGGLLLANKMGAGVPDWIFTWPCILILVGIYTGMKHRFQNFGWLILVGIGSLFLIDQQQWVNINIKDYTLPIVFIAIGLLFITRPRHAWHRRDYRSLRKQREQRRSNDEQTIGLSHINTTDGEYIEINSVFGGGKKIVFSKNFKGGEINCFMGGAEVDLTQADIQGSVVLEINAVFGGAKLIVPPHWDVKIETTSVFAGMEDKRPPIATQVDPNKVLIIKGGCVFAGIEIKSY